MTNEEFDKLCEELEAQGMTEKDILGVVLQMFEDGKIDLEEMKKLASARGYELTEEFMNKAGQSAPAPTAPDTEGDITPEEVEDAQEVEEGEETEEESEESDSEDEKDEARKLYGLK